MKNGQFAALFRHEYHMEFRRLISRKWVWLYFVGLAALALTALTIWGGAQGFRPEYMLYISYAFPYAVFGISFRSVKREWSNSTYGWWLTLPFSRSRLLLAKYAASMAQSGLLLVVYFGVIFALGLYNTVLHGAASGELKQFVATIVQYVLIVVVTAPFMLSLGQIAALLSRSKLKAVLPLVWVVFGVLGNALNWLNLANQSGSDDQYNPRLISEHTSPWIWLAIPAVWLVAALLYAGAVKVCKKYLAL